MAGILATGFAAETRRDNFLKTWETVSKVPFFATLGPAAIADVTHMLRTMDLPARTMIIRKGQQETKMVTLGRLEDGAFSYEMDNGANVSVTIRVDPLTGLTLRQLEKRLTRPAPRSA